MHQAKQISNVLLQGKVRNMSYHKNTGRLLTILLAFIFFSGSAFALEIEHVMFKRENLPREWEMKKNYVASPGELLKWSDHFGVKPLLGLSNQVFIVEMCRLQVNFVQCADEKQAGDTARRMHKQVGHMNRILYKENIVVEIMTRPENIKLKNLVVRMLSPVKEAKQ